MKGRRLVLWRHGRTEWNLARRVQGRSDIPLDDEGHRQAASAAARLASLDPKFVMSSPLQRAADTAKYLAAFQNSDVVYDERLMEVSYGVREGLTVSEAWAQYPNEMAEWKGSADYRFPGAESQFEAAERFVAAVKDALAGLENGQTGVIVAHGGVIRVGTCRFLGLPTDYWYTMGGLSNCSWSVLDETVYGEYSQWRIGEWNAGTLPEPVLSDDEDPAAPAPG